MLRESRIEGGSIYKTDVSFPQNAFVTNIFVYIFKEATSWASKLLWNKRFAYAANGQLGIFCRLNQPSLDYAQVAGETFGLNPVLRNHKRKAR